MVSEQLDIVPAKVRVLRHVRGKYRCPSCEGHLRTAPMPAQPLAKSFASPGLLAFIVTAKYVDGLPLYRQQQQFGRIGVELSRTTLAQGGWVGMGELVVPLMNLLHDELLERPYVLMDETTVQVLKEPGQGGGIEIAAVGDDEPGAGAAHRGVRVRPDPRGRGPHDGCWQGSAERCTPMATAATARRCANTAWCTWPVGGMVDADSPTC